MSRRIVRPIQAMTSFMGRLAAGDYDCTFKHSLAKHPGQEGDAKFRVAPAIRHGWYMTVLLECGDSAD